jgi:hypothetical protein
VYVRMCAKCAYIGVCVCICAGVCICVREFARETEGGSVFVPILSFSLQMHAKAFTCTTFLSHSFLLHTHIHRGHAHFVSIPA